MVKAAETIMHVHPFSFAPDGDEAPSEEQLKKRAKKGDAEKRGRRTINELFAKVKPK
jgi:hypothetical protein